MDYSSEIAAYKALAMLLVGAKNTPDSIEPIDAADIGIELADLLLPILNKINGFGISGGTAAPLSGAGSEDDLYIQGGTKLIFWRKKAFTWIKQTEVDLGIQIVDGNISLQSSVKDSLVTVSPGSWAIGNTIYSKSTQTQFNLATADANYNRIDAVYANTANALILYSGVANGNPAPPDKPNDTILVTYIYVPSLASGNPPYIADSNTPVIIVTGNDVKSKITVPDGAKLINWQTDIIPNNTLTYAQKHGNSIANIQGHYDAGGGVMTPYSPEYTYTLNGDGTINILTLTTVFAGTIIII
jgi:hypothetical protein